VTGCALGRVGVRGGARERRVQCAVEATVAAMYEAADSAAVARAWADVTGADVAGAG
jgi:hypothetical protein